MYRDNSIIMKSIFNPFPTISTERLILRETARNDLESILFLRSDPEVNKFIKRDTPVNLHDAEVFLNKIIKGMENEVNVNWAITLREEPSMIGSICLWNFSADRKTAEIGYDLHTAFQNRGIMSEAMGAVVNYGFKQLNLDEIVAYTHCENISSRHLLTKCGFILMPELRDEDNQDNRIFSLKKS